ALPAPSSAPQAGAIRHTPAARVARRQWNRLVEKRHTPSEPGPERRFLRVEIQDRYPPWVYFHVIHENRDGAACHGAEAEEQDMTTESCHSTSSCRILMDLAHWDNVFLLQVRQVRVERKYTR